MKGFLGTASIAVALCACSPAPVSNDGPLSPDTPSSAGADTASPADTVPPADTTPPNPPPSAVTSAEPTPKACTEIGCESSLKIPIVWGKDTLTATKYTVELTVDGKKGKCEVLWPYKSCVEPRKPTCTGDVQFELATGCKQGGTTTKDMTLGPVVLRNTPSSASIKVWRDKVMLHQQDLSFTYEERRPNGPGCEPLCKQGSRMVCLGTCTKDELAAAPPDTP